MRYLITLRSGVILEVTTTDATKSVIGLWKWALRQMTPQVIAFNECAVLATEISVMTPVIELEEVVF